MKIRLLRRIVQITTVIFIFAIPIFNKKGITVIMGSLYSLAIGPVWITDPLSGFQVIISTLSADSALLLSMLIPVGLALVFGRAFCSWMCPQNTISELFDYVPEKLNIKRLIRFYPSPLPRYVILIILLIVTPLLGFPLANLISAPGIISVQASKYVYEGVVGLETGLVGIIVLTEFFVLRRAWCNYICPVGSFLGIFRLRKTLKVVYAEDAEHVCGRCLACVDACQLGLNPMEGKLYPLCHNCGDCVAACEKMRAKGKPLFFRF